MAEQEYTEFDKYVYNSYLAAIAKASKRPFRPRKNFDKLEDEVYATIKQLSVFFNRSGINVEDFFHAPFVVYDDETYKAITFYVTSEAVTTYTRFKRLQETCVDEGPLTEYTLKGLAFLTKYCIENGISIEQYKQERTSSDIPLCLLHLKEHKINFYVIHALEIRNEIYKLDKGWREFYVKDFDYIFRNTFKTYSYSNQLKEKSKKAIQIIQEKLK
jgi:hypothetical protein